MDKTKCHVVGYTNQWGDRESWYIGVDDYQIYGQIQENKNKETEGRFSFEMTELKKNVMNHTKCVVNCQFAWHH